MTKSHQESRRSSEDSTRCRLQEEVRGVHSAEGRTAPTECARDERQGGGRVVRGEEYISQAKLMGWGEEIREEFDKGLKNFFLIYLFIGLAKMFTSARCYGKTSMNILAQTMFVRGSNVIRPK